MKTIILVSSLLFSILIYSQPTGELKISKVNISFFDKCQNKISFNKRGMSYKDKKNKQSVVSFFFKNYEVDIENRKSVAVEIVPESLYPPHLSKEDNNNDHNEFITLLHPYYQKLGWEKAVINEELIIKWIINKETMEIIIRPDIQDNIDLLNPPHINISFKKGLFEITDLEKSFCCD